MAKATQPGLAGKIKIPGFYPYERKWYLGQYGLATFQKNLKSNGTNIRDEPSRVNYGVPEGIRSYTAFSRKIRL